MRKSILAVATAGVITASLGGGAISSVSAANAAPEGATVKPAAAAGYFHLYEKDNYGGGHYTFTKSVTEFTGHSWSTHNSLQNSASSMQNYSASSVLLANIGTSCSGASYVAKAHSIDPSFKNNNFDNLASCMKYL